MPQNNENSSEAADKSGNYEVGYGKPPQDTRWKKGQSGNPSGRKKQIAARPPSVAEMLEDMLNETVRVQVGGRIKRMTRLEAMLRNQVNKAAGSERAFNQVLKLMMELRLALAKDTNTGGVLVVHQQLPLDQWREVAEYNQRKYRHPRTHYDEHGNPDLDGPWKDRPTRLERLAEEIMQKEEEEA